MNTKQASNMYTKKKMTQVNGQNIATGKVAFITRLNSKQMNTKDKDINFHERFVWL